MARKQDDGCCNLSCMKVLYMFFNVILLLTGIGIMGVGIWFFISKDNFKSLLGSDYYIIVPGLMIAAGFLVIFVCIVGCVAVIRENRFILVSYIIMLVLIFILEISTGIVAIVYRSQISEELLNDIKGKMNQYGFANDVTKAIDELQKKSKVVMQSRQISKKRKPT